MGCDVFNELAPIPDGGRLLSQSVQHLLPSARPTTRRRHHILSCLKAPARIAASADSARLITVYVIRYTTRNLDPQASWHCLRTLSVGRLRRRRAGDARAGAKAHPLMASRKLNSQQGIQSIEVGARLLQALAQASHPQMLRDLAAAAQMPAAKAHRYLVSFARMGLVEQNVETGLYDLGPFALDLGLAALARLEAVTASGPALAELREETGQTVALAVWANHGATIVRWLGADTPVSASLRVGAVLPLTRSATGEAFLAFLPTETTAPFVRKELVEHQRQGLTPTTREEVDQIIAQTRRRGFARTNEFIPGISGMAVPVFDYSGAMALALIALGYSKPFDAQFEKISGAVVCKAEVLSQRLGARAAS
jgi:DNA-binding IclR family transcriptional regulator